MWELAGQLLPEMVGLMVTPAAIVACLLLLGSSRPFVVPTLVFVLAGEPGRRWLRSATRWLLGHNRAIGVGVLLVFGLLFVGRGLAQIAG